MSGSVTLSSASRAFASDSCSVRWPTSASRLSARLRNARSRARTKSVPSATTSTASSAIAHGRSHGLGWTEKGSSTGPEWSPVASRASTRNRYSRAGRLV